MIGKWYRALMGEILSMPQFFIEYLSKMFGVKQKIGN